MDIEYIRTGDYFIPNLKLTEEPRPVGRWGRMYGEYLKEHRHLLYSKYILSGTLSSILADLNEQVTEKLEQITEQMKAAEGITEAMKARDPMAWVGAMNNIRSRAEEIVLHELFQP